MAYNPASQLVHLTQATNAYVWTGHPTTETNYAHNGLNRDGAIVAISGGFDPNGNLAKDGTRTFTYDVMNRMTSESGGAAPLNLVYDPMDRIYQTTSGSLVTQFLYDGDRLIAEYNGSSSTPLRRYVHGVGTDEPLVWYEGTDPNNTSYRRWLHADRQGSIVAWSDKNDTHYYTYGPYGEPQDWQGSRFRYTGQIALPEAQLYHYKARVYDPIMGRFLQTDPIGQQDDPNLYAYVKGDPENRADPSGMQEGVAPPGLNASLSAAAQSEFGTPDNMLHIWAKAYFSAYANVLSFAAVPEGRVASTGVAVLGHFPQYMEVGTKMGANLFSLPAKMFESLTAEAQWGLNQSFLDAQIRAGSRFRLATPASDARPGSFFAKELEYMKSKGFLPSKDGRWLEGPKTNSSATSTSTSSGKGPACAKAGASCAGGAGVEVIN